jgi:pyruvate/2-oxoglutarate dehydrogenase complex dihydrolipoamide dehydrogenase (E3) component
MTFDVIIIGTGQAGVPLATKLAAAGKRVLVAERGAAGGTCSNTGCTPTKTMIASARAAHVARNAGRLGVRVSDVRVDFPAVVARKDALVARWRTGVERRLQADGITFVRGHARFVGGREVELAGARHQAETIVINVGARPAVPPVPGLGDVPWLDNRQVMALPELPAHLLVMGGGYVGCELGQLFRRLGARVTILQRGPRLLPNLDEELSVELARVFESEGITLALGAALRGVSASSGEITVTLADGPGGDRALGGSHLLVATGRRPNTDDLGCAEAGIALDAKGFIVADEQYRTSVPGVFAVGDCIDQPQFTHTSWDDHRRLLALLRGQTPIPRQARHIPFTAFTDPQVAGVGLTEREARDQGLAYEVATMPFGNIARAIELDETAGLLKVIVDPKTERLLGAFIVGAEAGELIHIFVALLQAGAPLRALVDAEIVHPTFAEGVQSVVMKLDRFSK